MFFTITRLWQVLLLALLTAGPVTLTAQVAPPLVTFIDFTQEPFTLNLSYEDNVPVAEGYLAVMSQGATDALYQVTEDSLVFVYQPTRSTRLTILGQGDGYTFIAEGERFNREVLRINNQDFTTTTVGEEFLGLENVSREEGDLKLLPDGRVIWWDITGLLSASPPYAEAVRLLPWQHTNPNPTEVSTYLREDGRLLLSQGNALYVSDGTPEGTHLVRNVPLFDSYELVQSGAFTYIWSTSGVVAAISADGGYTELQSDSALELLNVAAVPGGVNIFEADDGENVRAFRSDGTIAGTSEIPMPIIGDGTSRILASTFGFAGEQVFRTILFRDSIALYTAGADLADWTYLTAIDRTGDFNNPADLEIGQIQDLTTSFVVELLVWDAAAGATGFENQLWVYRSVLDQTFQRLPVENFDDYSIPVKQTVNGALLFIENFDQLYHQVYLLDRVFGGLISKGEVRRQDFSFRQSGQFLYGFYREDRFGGDVHYITTDLFTNTGFDDYTFGNFNDWPGVNKLMEFPDRFTALTRDNDELFYYNLYLFRQNRSRVAEPVAVGNDTNQGSGFRSVKELDNTVLIDGADNTPNNSALAFNGPDEPVSVWRSVGQIQAGRFIGATDSLLIFEGTRRVRPFYRLNNRRMGSEGVVTTIPDDESIGLTRSEDYALFNNSFYYSSYQYSTNETTISIHRRALQPDSPEETIFTRTYSTPTGDGERYQRAIVSPRPTSQRLFILFPSGRTVDERMLISMNPAGEFLLPEDTEQPELFYQVSSDFGPSEEGLFIRREVPFPNEELLTQKLWVKPDGRRAVEINGVFGNRQVLPFLKTTLREDELLVGTFENTIDGQTGFFRVAADGSLLEEYLVEDVNWYAVYDGKMIGTRLNLTTGNHQLFEVAFDGSAPRDIAELPSISDGELDRHAQLINGRVYYLGDKFRTLQFYDLPSSTGGTVVMPDHVPDAENTFGPIVSAKGLIVGVATSTRFGREPFYLDPATGRLIQGQLFVDNNDDDVFNEGDLVVPRYPVDVVADAGFLSTTTTDDGQYALLVDAQTAYNVSPRATDCPEGFTPTAQMVPPGEADEELNFFVRPGGSEAAAELQLTAARLRCQQQVPLWVSIRNQGCINLAGTLTVTLPASVQFESADFAATQVDDGTVQFTITDLSILQHQQIQLLITAPDETFTGQELRFSASFQSNLLAEDVEVEERGTVFCSYDPNDKAVQPQREDPNNANYSEWGEELIYTIRFQNTGNDTAYTVSIKDQLDAGLDLTSLRVIDQSHSCAVTLDDKASLTVSCPDIFLPDSTTNLAASQGFVRFGITPLDGVPDGRRVENTASIFFDGNAPIITNTVFNTVVPFLDQDQDGYLFYEDCADDDPAINPGAEEIPGNDVDENCDGSLEPVSIRYVAELEATVYPNPTSDWIRITPAGVTAPVHLTILDAYGRALRAETLPRDGNISLRELPSGAYFLLLRETTTGKTGRVCVVRK